MSNQSSLLAVAVASLLSLAACGSHSSSQPGPSTSAQATYQPDAVNRWSTLRGIRPTWATTERLVGPADTQETLQVHVYLRMRNEALADVELAAIANPASPRYRQFLTDEQFAARYGPTDEDVQALATHFKAYGLAVTYVPANRAYVALQGTAAAAEAAFATQLGSYFVGSTVRRAPMADPRLPAAIAPRVLSVFGLSTPVQMSHRHLRQGELRGARAQLQPMDGPSAGPCSEWYGATADLTDPVYGDGWSPITLMPCAYRPPQIRAAYGFNELIRHGNDGTGVTIAIVDAYLSPTLVQDAQVYAANNDPDYPLDPSQVTTAMGPGTASDPDTGWYSEQSLDIEAVHAMAPGARVAYVGAQSATDQDLAGALNYVLTGHLADIISNSWGSIESESNNFVIFHSVATQAGLKGITLLFSSGDSGDESAMTMGPPSPDFPASLDNATAVGGTSLALDRTGSILWQAGWETSASWLQPDPSAPADAGTQIWYPSAPGLFAFGSGGGTSSIYEQPGYQKGVVPNAIADLPGAPARVVPDVAMLADPMTGFLVGQSDPKSGAYTEQGFGGTSLASPLMAATLALAQQYVGHPFGFVNPLLYASISKGAFLDVVPLPTREVVLVQPGVVATFDFTGQTIQTAVGYDNVTGIGVPNGAVFLEAMKAPAPPSSVSGTTGASAPGGPKVPQANWPAEF